MNALNGGLIGSVLFLLFTIFAEPGRWMFVSYSENTAMLLYFCVGLAFTAMGVMVWLLIRSLNT